MLGLEDGGRRGFLSLFNLILEHLEGGSGSSHLLFSALFVLVEIASCNPTFSGFLNQTRKAAVTDNDHCVLVDPDEIKCG